MYNLTKRQEAILYYILESKENITINKLAAKYQLSKRMIHYDFDYINTWLKDKGCALKKSKTSIYVEYAQECKHIILNELYKDDVKKTVLNKQERQEYIFNKLMLADEIITSESFVKDLMVSRTTILSELKDVEEKLRKVHLEIKGKKGSGYWISGKEVVIRNQIIECIIKILIKNRIYNYNTLHTELFKGIKNIATDYSMAFNYLKGIDIEPIYEMLNILRKENGILVSDADSLILFISMVVTVKRLARGFTVKKENITEIERNEETKRFVLAWGISEKLEDDYEIRCSEFEISYIILTLVKCNVDFVKKDKEYRRAGLEDTVDLMLQHLKDFKVVYINGNHMQDLKDDLYEYLNLILRKRKLQIMTSNPLLVQTKAGYPEIYEEASRMAEIFKSREGIALTEEEIAAITIYIAAYEDHNQEQNEKAVMIVCNEGKGLSKVLYNRIKNNIPNLKIRSIISVYEVNQNLDMFNDVDFIISTVELPDLNLPVFCVSPIISVLDIRNISDYVSGNKSMKVVDDHQKQENYLKDVIISILTKYLEASQLSIASKELDYFLKANTGFVTIENAQLIKEEYAYKVSTVIVKLSDMFHRIREVTGKDIEIDTLVGLIIHIAMSVSRWEKKEFYQEKGPVFDEAYLEPIYRLVERFLDDVSDIFQYTIGKCEAAAIMRYLL